MEDINRVEWERIKVEQELKERLQKVGGSAKKEEIPKTSQHKAPLN